MHSQTEFLEFPARFFVWQKVRLETSPYTAWEAGPESWFLPMLVVESFPGVSRNVRTGGIFRFQRRAETGGIFALVFAFVFDFVFDSATFGLV
jgi:hypothetical protein